MKAHPVVSKTVLITGCSSGIGRSAAHILRQHGWHVLPTARKTEDLDSLRAEGFTPIALDVADEESVRTAVEETLRITKGELGALVNNAGFGQPGAMEDLTREAIRYQFEVNVLGLQDLTNRLMPVFHKQGYGRIVHVSSVLGRIIMPFMGIYCASKHAVEAMADAMRVELSGTGITVSIVEPGPIKTEFGKNALERARQQLPHVQSRFSKRYENRARSEAQSTNKTPPFTLPPESVAHKIRHALESPRPHRRYPVTFVAYAGAFMRRFFPDAWMDAMMSARLTKQE